VMEPIRGGALAQLSEAHAGILAAINDRPAAEWALRFLHDVPGLAVVLSGMSNLQQMKENVATFQTLNPLSDREKEAVFAIAEQMKDSVPCTACRYCCDGCPMGLDIPTLLADLNEMRYAANMLPTMRVGLLPP
ncbi:MAG: aldo/keto reductase, partial [Butyricicoccus sp.]|nr:aldo/keto reductase [Butyricicoccus sp.]